MCELVSGADTVDSDEVRAVVFRESISVCDKCDQCDQCESATSVAELGEAQQQVRGCVELLFW